MSAPKDRKPLTRKAPSVPVATLEARVAELEQLVEAMSTEVRTRRIVVVDEMGAERIGTEVGMTYTELRVTNAGQGRHEHAVVLSIDESDYEGATIDCLLSGGGNIASWLQAYEVPGGWRAALQLDDADGMTTLRNGDIERQVFG